MNNVCRRTIITNTALLQIKIIMMIVFSFVDRRNYDIILILICEGVRYNHAVTDTVSSGSKLSTKFSKMGP